MAPPTDAHDRAARKPKRIGPIYEDGSYRVEGGKVYDPDTGKVRYPIRRPAEGTTAPPTDAHERAASTKAEVARRERLRKARAERERREAERDRNEKARQAAARKRERELAARTRLSARIPTLRPQTSKYHPLTEKERREVEGEVIFPKDVRSDVERAARETKPRHLEYAFGPSAATPGFQKGDVLDVALLAPLGRPVAGVRAGVRGVAALRGGRAAASAAAKTEYKAGSLVARAVRASRKRPPTRTLRVGEKVQQFPTYRSRVTRRFIERPADVVSRRMMGEGRVAGAARRILPTASAEARVAKAAGRAQSRTAERTQAAMAEHTRALPKPGSAED